MSWSPTRAVAPGATARPTSRWAPPGLVVLDPHAGLRDSYGNELAVTAPALADEIAAAADLVKGKLAGTPVAVVRGLEALVLGATDDGPGAAALVRDESVDMFGLGAREAVLAAVAGSPGGLDLRGFGAPAPVEDVLAALAAVVGGEATVRREPGGVDVIPRAGLGARAAGRLEARVEAVARAHAWDTRTDDGGVRTRPRTP